MATRNSLAGLALAQLFGLVVEHGKPIVTEELLAQVRSIISGKLDNVIANDARDGWGPDPADPSVYRIGDDKNDYPGDPVSKRLDNFLFLFGKNLPGRATDLIRDNSSRVITPRLRPQVHEGTSGEEMARIVGDALYDEAASLGRSI